MAKHRKPRFEQDGPHLRAYVQSFPEQDRQKVVSRLAVDSSKRSYSDLARPLPGSTFYHEGHRYVKSGQQRRGTALRAAGKDKACNVEQCRVVSMGGLVYL